MLSKYLVNLIETRRVEIAIRNYGPELTPRLVTIGIKSHHPYKFLHSDLFEDWDMLRIFKY